MRLLNITKTGLWNCSKQLLPRSFVIVLFVHVFQLIEELFYALYILQYHLTSYHAKLVAPRPYLQVLI